MYARRRQRLTIAVFSVFAVWGLVLSWINQPALAADAPSAAATSTDAAKRAPPYFVSLRFDVAYFRTGPGKRYPITWVYHRRELPLRVEREFENWSYVVDPSGQTGWVSQAALSNRRTFQLVGQEQIVRADPHDDATPVAKIETGALGRVRACAASEDWCQVEVSGGLRGWLPRGALWGVMQGEVIGGT